MLSIQALLLLSTAVLSSSTPLQQCPRFVSSVSRLTNPFTAANTDFPDPSVLSYNGKVYAYATTNYGRNIPVAVLDTPSDLVNGPSTFILQDADSLPLDTTPDWINASDPNPWAPDVIQLSDAPLFAMTYTAHTTTDTRCIGVAHAVDPLGPFVPVEGFGPVCGSGEEGLPNTGAIDSAYYKDADGRLYLLFKIFDWTGEGKKEIVMQEVDAADGFTYIGAPSHLLGTLAEDEGIVEAPILHKFGEWYILFVSTHDYLSGHYDVSYAFSQTINGEYERPADTRIIVTNEAVDSTSPGGMDCLPAGADALSLQCVLHSYQFGQSGTGPRELRTAELSLSIGVDGKPVVANL